jgi:hypothetical protein
MGGDYDLGCERERGGFFGLHGDLSVKGRDCPPIYRLERSVSLAKLFSIIFARGIDTTLTGLYTLACREGFTLASPSSGASASPLFHVEHGRYAQRA